MQNKSKNKSNSQPIKKQRPKPEWTTDFVDREQYKLTEVERIQKKASLQSKNREQARRELEQRRKKLQMGIIDDQTRKIYETALISKNIDIHPPTRRNLTEMIRYEKQQKEKMMADEENFNGSQNEEELDEVQQSMRQLKEAQNFIKKFQKAKKQQKIERAVEILSNHKSLEIQRKAPVKEPQTKVNNFISASNQENLKRNKSSSSDPKASNKSESFSQDDALSSIEDTIRFMEEKLFAAKKTVDEHSKSFISDVNESFENERMNDFRPEQKETIMPLRPTFKKAQRVDKEVTELKFRTQDNLNHEELSFGDKIGEISQLRIKLKGSDGESSDDECLDTIRRMRELMENKESDYENCQNKKMKENIRDNFTPSAGILGFNSTIQKRSYQSGHDSEAEVSFNLTMNDDELQQESSIFNITKSKFKSSETAYNKNQPFQNFEKKKEEKPLKKQSKEDKYQEEYQKIKQNLFSCINSNNEEGMDKKQKYQNKQKSKPSFSKFNEDSDEEEKSEDSLMVQDKINMWKKELEHQVDPDEEDHEGENINFKTTAFSKKPEQVAARAQINKQQREDEEEDGDEPYRYNYLSKQKNENTNSLNSNNYQHQYQTKQANNDLYPNKVPQMKKPPIAKKSHNNQKFEQMKKMISNASTEIHKIQIQPLKIQPMGGGEVLGFDFRGSINIKKNILSK